MLSWILIAINIGVFLWELEVTAGFSDQEAFIEMLYQYGAIPLSVVNAARVPDIEILSTLFSSMFLHGGFAHLGGNMIYLYVFGDNIEDRFGKLGFLASYIVFGLGAGLTHSYVSVLSEGARSCASMATAATASCTPAVGASGAISGVLGAYLAMFPTANIRTIFLSPLMIGRVIRVPAYFYLGFWFILQLMYGLLGELQAVAYWAHIGGFAAGFMLGLIFRVHSRIRSR